MSEPLVTLRMRPSEIVVTDTDYSGYRAGHCIACDASGWIDGHGYPFGSRGKAAHLKHKKACPLNRVLRPNGELKKQKRGRK